MHRLEFEQHVRRNYRNTRPFTIQRLIENKSGKPYGLLDHEAVFKNRHGVKFKLDDWVTTELKTINTEYTETVFRSTFMPKYIKWLIVFLIISFCKEK